MNKESVTEYYDYTLSFYKLLWYRKGGSQGIHYGLWEEGTNSLQEALINTNKVLADYADLTEQDKVLDAGCGVGGSAIWLAKNYGCNVTGITISEDQIEEARRLAEKEQVQDKVNFKFDDFTDTDFEDEKFDVVWGIESICHAEEKLDFIKEAYRLLKHGGKLVVADGFLAKEPENNREEKIVEDFYEGFALPGLERFEKFKEKLFEAGFKNVESHDKTEQIMPTSKRMYNMARVAYPISIVTEKLRLTSPILTKHSLTGLRQYSAFKDGLLKYGIFYAEKA